MPAATGTAAGVGGHHGAHGEAEDEEERSRWVPAVRVGRERTAGGEERADGHPSQRESGARDTRTPRVTASCEEPAGHGLHPGSFGSGVVAAVQRR